MPDLSPILLTLQLALVTTIILLVIGVPLAYWLAMTRSRWKFIVDPLVSLPLVLPPTVLGFYILLIFSPNSWLGQWIDNTLNINIVFSFAGLVIGSVLSSLPFMVNPVKAGFQGFPTVLMEASSTLGKSPRETLFKVILPNIKPSLWTGIILAFAHTMGEFGVVLMVGGSIPGETRTASIAIFSEVEALNYAHAHVYAVILLVLAFTMLFGLNVVHQKGMKGLR